MAKNDIAKNDNNDNVVIIGSLNDQELKNSIDALVMHVEAGTQKIATNFDNTIEGMKKKLQSLGNISIDMGSASDVGSSRRTKKIQDEAQGVRNLTISYDQLTIANQRAMQPKSAEQSFYVFIQNLREQAAKLANEIKSIPSITTDKQSEEYKRYENELKELKSLLADYKKELNDVYKKPNASRVEKQSALANIEETKRLIKQIEKEQILSVQRISREDNAAMEAKKRRLEEIKKTIHELTIEEKNQSIGSSNKSVATTQELKKQRDEKLNTIATLREEIAVLKSKRESMEQNTSTLKTQNNIIAEKEQLLKRELMSEKQLTEEIKKQEEALERRKAKDLKKQQSSFKFDFDKASHMSENDLARAEIKLKSMINAISEMRKSKLFNDVELNKAQEKIDRLKKTIADLRSQKPTTLKNVLGMDESSVDAIAKKMAALRKVTVDPQNTAQVKQLGDEYQRLSKLQTSLLGKNAQVIRSNNYLAQSFGYIRNRLVYALTLGAISNFTKELYQIRGQYELLERSLGVLLDDMGKGSQIFRELNAMSLKSPFTLIELAGAAKQLTAYNFAADEVVDTTRRLADISAALGVPMERLVYNLGQIRAQNVLNARDARDFANAGLPIVSMLADMYTEQNRFGDEMVTTANVYDMMSKKMVSYADVLQVINKVTDEGGKFFDFQAKQADTLQVQMANLNLAYNNMLNSIGKENQGVLAGGLSIVKDLLLNWRQVYRVLMTLITTYGAYRTAVALVGWEHKRTFGARMLISIQQWVNGIKNAKTAMQALNAAMSSNVLGLFVSALAAAVSYFWLFNNSADEMKEKLKEIQETFTSMRSNATDIFVSGLKSDNVNTQIDKLKELVSFAESELGITIPVNVQDVDAENVAQKLRETKNQIDEYLDFAQAFSETAAGNKYLNKYFTEFGNTAQSTFTNIYSSVNTVIEGLQKLADEGRASARDLEILEELVTGKKDDESKLEYLQRLVSLYEELGLIGRKVVTPVFSYTHSAEDNMEFLEEQQNKTLDRIKVHNKQVFATMLQDVQDFYSNASIAKYQLERTVKELAERIDINSIPEDQRTLKLSAAINEEASKNNWNDFAKQYARQVANTKFGTTIEISDKSKKNTEVELKEWQKKLQSWADAKGIVLGITLNFNTTEVDAANEALQNVKKAQELLAVQQRKLKVGTATQADVDAAKKALKNARLVATQAGSDLASLNRKGGGSGGSKKDNVLDVLKDEISLVKKLQSEYDKLTKSGVKSADAIVAMQDAYGSTLRLLNKDLQKFGLPRIELSNILGKNPHEILAVFTKLRNILESKGLSNLERMKAVEVVIEELKVSAKTYDMKKVTDGLNRELGKIKDEYELAVELDANPELGNMFADMFGITPDMLSKIPHTVGQLVDKYQDEIDKQLKGKFSTPFNILKTDINEWAKASDVDPQSELIKTLSSKQNEARGLVKKTYLDIQKMVDDYVKEYGNQQQQIEKIEKEKNNALLNLNSIYNTDALRQTKEYINAKETIENAARIKEAKASFDALKKTTDYERFFNAIDTLTSKDALAIKAKIKQGIVQAFKDGVLTVSEFRREIKALESQFDKLTESSSLWTNYLSGGFDKLIKKAKETGQEIETIGESISIKGTIDDKDKNFLKSMGRIFSNGNGGTIDFTSLMNKFGGNMKGLGDAVSKAGQGMQQGAGAFASAVAVIDTIIKNVHQTVQAIGSVIDELDSVRNEDNKISNAYWEGFKKFDNYAMSGWENLKSGNVAGAIGDTANSIISVFNTFSNAKNVKINKQIKASERTVKDLENAYKNLERAVNEAYGASDIAAKKAEIANKKLQLAELQRQLQLERSRDSKKRDASKIADLEGQIIDLKNEIKDMENDVTNSFLGISSVKDAVGSMMDDIVDALRNGEDAMGSFNDSIDDMIANMIKQVFSARILGPMLKKIWDKIDADIQKRGKAYADYYTNYKATLDHIDTTTNKTGNGYYFWKDKSGTLEYSDNRLKWLVAMEYGAKNLTYKQWHDILQGWADWAQEHLKEATTPTMDDVRRFGTDLRQVAPELEGYMDELEDILREMGLIKDATSKEALSKLQQGIQGVTEDTAGAIEAYMNIVAQRVFEQNLYLQEIRDHLNNFDLDVQLGTLSQMLLQLQQSYQVQQNIESILTGVLNPSGRAIVVELNS